LAAAAYIVFSNSYPGQERWVFATGAAIVGFWMKPSAR
jgi:hypothetical protein